MSRISRALLAPLAVACLSLVGFAPAPAASASASPSPAASASASPAASASPSPSGSSAKANPGHAPTVTRVHVNKSARTMQLFDGDSLVSTFAVAVGKGGAGPKKKEGDNVTPVGRYRVVKHVPSHLRMFLKLDYPNAADRARFEELKKRGELPKGATIGGEIGIHGEPPEAKPFNKARYQSHGCVVLEDAEIDQVARMVPDGTTVEIED